MDRTTYDVVVIGGGAAGLSGALVLARARRSVLVVDAGQQRNLPAQAVHGYLGREGISPRELVEVGAGEVRSYGGEVVQGTALSARAVDGGFEVDVDGAPVRARGLLVTTGLVDELPDVPGLAAQWGRVVIHCPYCHGWEVQDEAIGVLATGPMWLHQATLFRQWTDDLTVLLHDQPAPGAEDLARLTARGVRVVEGRVTEVLQASGRLTGVRAGGTVVPLAALAVAPRFTARSAVLASLGIAAEPFVMGEADLGTHVPASPTGATSVPRVYVAGNVTQPQATVLVAAAGAVTAAAMLNGDLVQDDVAALLR